MTLSAVLASRDLLDPVAHRHRWIPLDCAHRTHALGALNALGLG